MTCSVFRMSMTCSVFRMSITCSVFRMSMTYSVFRMSMTCSVFRIHIARVHEGKKVSMTCPFCNKNVISLQWHLEQYHKTQGGLSFRNLKHYTPILFYFYAKLTICWN